MPKFYELGTSVGLLVLRVGIGGYMMTHGWGKVQMLRAGDTFPADPIGLGPQTSLVLVMLAEFVCAGLVLIGLGTRLAAMPIVFAMGVAAFVAHANDPWTLGAGASKQPALMFATVFLALIFTGAGRISLDALLWPKIWRRPCEPAPQTTPQPAEPSRQA